MSRIVQIASPRVETTGVDGARSQPALALLRKKRHKRLERSVKNGRGVATAHSRDLDALWLSLLEKAFAKYYGSYANIARGYAHHALEVLTGHHAECVHLSHASRGVNRRTLWGFSQQHTIRARTSQHSFLGFRKSYLATL